MIVEAVAIVLVPTVIAAVVMVRDKALAAKLRSEWMAEVSAVHRRIDAIKNKIG